MILHFVMSHEVKWPNFISNATLWKRITFAKPRTPSHQLMCASLCSALAGSTFSKYFAK